MLLQYWLTLGIGSKSGSRVPRTGSLGEVEPWESRVDSCTAPEQVGVRAATTVVRQLPSVPQVAATVLVKINTS